MKSKDMLSDAISRFGATVKGKLKNPAATGAPEDQLRAPLETLLRDVGDILGYPPGAIVPVGENSLSDLKVRPDYAISRQKALIGFIEVKAPGKGADPRKFTDKHDKEQWRRLKSLPNLIYTDGNAFSLWQNGELAGQIERLDGDIESSGASLSASPSLKGLFSSFFSWEPIPPGNAQQLAEVSARLCRLLRDEVTEQLEFGSKALTNLKDDWRRYLFPNATDAEFADGYAQALTFGMLMAKARGVTLDDGLDRAAKELRKTNSLIGTAFRILTDEAENQDTLKTSLGTLTRVLDVIDWAKISKGNPEAWLYFYEEFLSAYDNDLRKKTGSYYTPPEIVTAMVRLVDEVLRDTQRFGVTAGLASPEVTLADPAVGTGTFLLGALRRIAKTKEDDEGPGAVPGAIKASLARLIGFEMQFGPFVVAQLRLLAEVAELMDLNKEKEWTPIALRLFLTNSLGNPNEEAEYIPTILSPLGESRRLANEIKRTEPITVVIGNPPYKDKAKGLGGWVESGSLNTAADAPLNAWLPPAEWGVGAHTKHLRNLYVYFWRWATWKVFGDSAAQFGDPKQKHQGIVCYITVAGFLNGPGFEKMRSDLRRDTNEIWVIDCSPEGHQPDVPTRVFQGVQHPVCIVLAVRLENCDPAIPAHVRFRSLPKGSREDKFTAITQLNLNSAGWIDCPTGWRSPFLPEATGSWAAFLGLDDLFVYNGSGVMPGRTWVIAPDPQSLRDRWDRLVAEKNLTEKENLFHPHLRANKLGDKHSHKVVKEGLAGHEHREISVAKDNGICTKPIQYGFRSFDRQWIVPDSRLLNQPNPTLWSINSKKQVYLTALTRHSPTSGSPLTFTGLIPDLHHYKGSFGGRAFPLWLDNSGNVSNIKPGILTALARAYKQAVTGEDVLAYVAAVASHPAFTQRFKSDLVQPGLRIPLTADAVLFAEAVAVGSEVIWLQTFGERFVSSVDGRSHSPPRLPKGQAPQIPKGSAIPADADSIAYDAAAFRLSIGSGIVENVTPAMWAYEVSGKHVISHWFSYRRKTRERPMIGDRRQPSPLGDIANGWLADYTTELVNLLNVLGRLIALEPKQADLLERVCAGSTLSSESLKAEGAFEVPAGVGVKSAKADAGGAQMKFLD
jgi:hypothetical protein